MNTILLATFAGISFAFALVSFFIWYINRKELLYIYFSIFSLFSSLYIFVGALPTTVSGEFGSFQIVCAALYYAVFPYFILKYVKVTKDNVALPLASIFGLALLFYFVGMQVGDFPVWQITAHIGLLGLVFVSWYALKILISRKDKFRNYFLFLTLFFTFLAFEEIITTYTDTVFLSGIMTMMMPLDIYPLIFSIIIGHRLALDIYIKARLESKLAKTRIRNKQLKIAALQKDILEKKLANKNKDLTDFGIKINKHTQDLKKVLKDITAYQQQHDSKSDQLNIIIKDIKTQLRIDTRNELFNQKILEVNHSFIEEVRLKFPTLTENEIHLVCLLKLKLNTKEIANIKNITPGSVKVLRFRLRKKLQLNTKTNLVSFLNSMQ